ncbi:phosphotransferase family protein [Streptomyces sp. YIM 98790]|uniref:phosphotransferase family protein n=1 Tax=Streptomyces sp. YIM 98790 TaxID=2689077 RepID=UPI00140CC4C9|nr:aminoglycoside phosphotransferase family protein [Streptomyces sp. YIM 98790]
MESRTKRHLTADQLDALLREATGVGCRLEAELTGGWYNAAYRVVLDDGRPAVVKIAPPSEVPVLRYERGIMATEAMVYRRAGAHGGIPGPDVLLEGPGFVVMSLLPGVPWDKAADGLAPETESALRRELGRVVARLHTMESPDGRFGYPAPEAGLSAPDWRTAFSLMVEALLDDAERWDSRLGAAPEEIRELVDAGGYALKEVTEPRLIHFDLWPGNIFIDPDEPRITGLIDHERAFWGDPVAELISLAFGGDIDEDSDVVAGYREAGGELKFDRAYHHRMALYRMYLGLILVVECSPRGYQGEHKEFTDRYLAEGIAECRTFL